MITQDEYTLEYLLAFNGRVHHLEQGYWVKFEIQKVSPTPERLHGLRYSFTLHAPSGKRLLGFDNAHTIQSPRKTGQEIAGYDHWHRTSDDKGRPYKFINADTLLADFYNELQRILKELGISEAVIDVSQNNKRNPL